MKKVLLIGSLVLVLALSLGFSMGSVFASAQELPEAKSDVLLPTYELPEGVHSSPLDGSPLYGWANPASSVFVHAFIADSAFKVAEYHSNYPTATIFRRSALTTDLFLEFQKYSSFTDVPNFPTPSYVPGYGSLVDPVWYSLYSTALYLYTPAYADGVAVVSPPYSWLGRCWVGDVGNRFSSSVRISVDVICAFTELSSESVSPECYLYVPSSAFVPAGSAFNVMSWLSGVGQSLMSTASIVTVLDTEVFGVPLYQVLFGGSFVLYVGWVIVKFVLPT